MRRPLTIWFLVAASLVGVVAWADLVLVFRTGVNAPVVATPSVQFVADNAAIDFTPTVTSGVAQSWTCPDLPTGASINSSTGAITGTVTEEGTHRCVLTATGGGVDYKVPLTIFVYTASENVASAYEGGPPFNFDTRYTRYVFTEAVTADGTLCYTTDPDVGVDLGGFSHVYNNATPITIANASFETVDSVESTRAENWDWTNAPASTTRFEGVFLNNEIYDGSYSIRFADTTATGYIESEATVTLLPNTTYSLTGMFEYGGLGTDSNPGVTGYVSIVGTGGETTITTSWNSTNNRGIQHRSTSFTTGSGTPTYNVRVGITGHASATEPFYIDDVRIQRHKSHGIAVGPKNTATEYPDVPLANFGGSANSVIANGTLTQGQDAGEYCNALRVHDSGCSFADLTLVVSGANSSCMYQGASTSSAWNSHIFGNTFTSNTSTITSRDAFNGAVLHRVQGWVFDNEITNGPHAGLALGGSVSIQSEAAYNTIALKAKYTNAYAILGGSTSGTLIHHNTINCGTGEFAARGIGASGGAVSTPQKVYSNTVVVQDASNNQEYEGNPLGGAYGIQVEGGNYVDIYDNTVTANGTGGEGHALRLGPYSSAPAGVNIYDNTLVAVNQGQAASPLKMLGPADSDLSGISFYDNAFTTNDAIIGGSGQCDITLLRTSITAANVVVSPAVYLVAFVDTASIHSVIEFRDTVFTDAASRTHFDSGTTVWESDTAIVDPKMQIDLSWTTNLTIQGDGVPLASTAVTIETAADTQVFSGSTDGSGNIAPTIVEQSIVGSATTEHNPHAVISAGYNEGALTVDQAGETATINLVSP